MFLLFHGTTQECICSRLMGNIFLAVALTDLQKNGDEYCIPLLVPAFVLQRFIPGNMETTNLFSLPSSISGKESNTRATSPIDLLDTPGAMGDFKYCEAGMIQLDAKLRHIHHGQLVFICASASFQIFFPSVPVSSHFTSEMIKKASL